MEANSYERKVIKLMEVRGKFYDNLCIGISFLLNLIVINVRVESNISKRNLEFSDVTFWAFSYVFSFVASLIQTYKGSYLYNAIPGRKMYRLQAKEICFLKQRGSTECFLIL